MIARNQLSQIYIIKDFRNVQIGSLVITEKGIFFIAIGQGKKMREAQKYFCISPEAPIGKILMHRSVGDELVFNKKRFKILTIV